MKLKITLTLVALSLLGLACIPTPSVTFTPSGSAMLDCYGNITPCSNMTYDIGRADRYFGTIYVSNVVGWMPLGGTGTVTATGTSAGHIPYFAAPFDLQNSSMYYSNMTGYIGIFDNTPGTQLDVTGQIQGYSIHCIRAYSGAVNGPYYVGYVPAHRLTPSEIRACIIFLCFV